MRPAGTTLDQAVAAHELEQINVPGDNNCFYHSLILMAGRHLVRYMPDLDLTPGVSRAVRLVNVQIVRSWLANRLDTDLEAARQGLPSRYAESVQPDDPNAAPRTETEVTALHRRAVAEIADMNGWDNNTGDLVVGLAARELGLPMTVIQARHDSHLGPDGDARLYFVRQTRPDHYLGTVTLDNSRAPQVPWGELSPPPPSTLVTARTEMRREINAARMRLNHARDAYHQAQGDAEAPEYRAALARFEFAEDNVGYDEDFLPHTRAGQRIADMRRAARAISELTQRLGSRPAESTASTSGGTGAGRVASPDPGTSGVSRPVPGAQRGGTDVGSPAAVPSVVFGPSAVPDDMLLSQAYLYGDGHGGYGVGHRGARGENWTEVGALAEYSLISWLTGADHTSVPGPEATVVQAVGPDLRRAGRFLTTDRSLPENTRVLRHLRAEHTDRRVRRTTAMPPTLPGGTWIWFSGDGFTGAAVVLPDGSRRFNVPGVESPGEADLHRATTFVIVAPKDASTPSSSGVGEQAGSDSGVGSARAVVPGPAPGDVAVREVAPLPISGEFVSNREQLNQLLAQHRRKAVDVKGDGNCFYRSAIVIAGPYLARHVPGMHATSQAQSNVQRLRDFLADRFDADLRVAMDGRELQPRYATSLAGYGTPERLRQKWVPLIRKWMQWEDDSGETVAELLAYELGLPVSVIQYGHRNIDLGPPGDDRIYFIREGDHYLGVEALGGGLAHFPWAGFNQRGPSTVEEAVRRMQAQRNRDQEGFGRVLSAFESVWRTLPAGMAVAAGIDPAAVREGANLERRLAMDDIDLDPAAYMRPLHRMNATATTARTIVDATQRLYGLAALLWLTHGQSIRPRIRGIDYRGLTSDLTSLRAMLDSLRENDPDPMPGWVAGALERQTGRASETIRGSDGLPEGLPEGTYVWFYGRGFSGARVIGPEGSSRSFMGDADPRRPSPELRGQAATYVILRPAEQGAPSIEMTSSPHTVVSGETPDPAPQGEGGTRGPADRPRGGAGGSSGLGALARKIYEAMTGSQGVLRNTTPGWTKSSYSEGEDYCVEVAVAEAGIWPR